MCDEFCVRIAPRDEQCVLGCCPGRTVWGQLPPLGWHLIGLLSAFGCLSLSSLPSLCYSIHVSLLLHFCLFFFYYLLLCLHLLHTEMLCGLTYLNPAVSLSLSLCPSLLIWVTAEESIGGRSLSSPHPPRIYYSLKHSHTDGPLEGSIVQLPTHTYETDVSVDALSHHSTRAHTVGHTCAK